MKRKLHIFVDSISYVKNEVYQHQLHSVLNEDYDCFYYEIDNISQFKLNSEDIVFSALKIRTLRSKLEKLSQILNGTHILVQDYDPWVSYEDSSQYKGTYELIASKLDVTFFVPHLEWSKFIISKGHRCVTSKIGMLPTYCDDTPWENRSINLEFRGSKYPSRNLGMQRLFDSGFPNCWTQGIIKPYQVFLNHLSNVKIWAHSESQPIIIDGKKICRNWIWPKAIEVLSRGCFLIRDYQPEAENYVKDMPTVFLFKREDEAISLLENIEKMSNSEKNDRIRSTVNQIKKESYYQVISHNIEKWWDNHV
jgi:hypothetical protein